VRHVRAVIDVAAAPVVVRVVRGIVGARVACIADPVAVAVALVGIADRGTIVLPLTHAVAVGVVGGVGGTLVARVAHAISVAVCLARIGDERAVIEAVDGAVAVEISRS
jgi:hypothetical protein